MARHVVTGGAGFIGSHIVEGLATRGDEVVVLDNFSTGKRGNLEGIAGPVEVREVDLARETSLTLTPLLEGADTVFHQAAIPSVPRSVKDPVSSHAANVNGTLNLLMACRGAGVRRVVYASSSSIYGDSPTLPKTESMSARPVSPYGAQKYFGEIYMQVFWRAYGLETVSLRYFNVFGPRQDATSQYSGVIAKFIPALLTGNRPIIYGDGSQSRDFTYVANVVDANLRAGEAERVEGEVFNVARGDRITVAEMLAVAKEIVGSRVEAVYEPPRAGDILHSQADATMARERLGWNPQVTFEEGLRHTIDWYRTASSTGL